jgi:hypothetical protein
MTKLATKKPRVRRLDALQKWQILNLGRRGGFSHRFIAAMVFKKKITKVTDSEHSCVSSHLHRNAVKVTHWRDGVTVSAQVYAQARMTPRKKI